jgi:hypothetical protein
LHCDDNRIVVDANDHLEEEICHFTDCPLPNLQVRRRGIRRTERGRRDKGRLT